MRKTMFLALALVLVLGMSSASFAQWSSWAPISLTGTSKTVNTALTMDQSVGLRVIAPEGGEVVYGPFTIGVGADYQWGAQFGFWQVISNGPVNIQFESRGFQFAGPVDNTLTDAGDVLLNQHVEYVVRREEWSTAFPPSPVAGIELTRFNGDTLSSLEQLPYSQTNTTHGAVSLENQGLYQGRINLGFKNSELVQDLDADGYFDKAWELIENGKYTDIITVTVSI